LREESVNETCSVCQCELSEKKSNWVNHIHTCHCREFVKTEDLSQVQYCFFCFNWFADNTVWEEHYHIHLILLSSNLCMSQVYHHMLISSELCLICLIDDCLSAAKRLWQWDWNFTLMNHVEKHVRKRCAWSTFCKCDTKIEDAESFYHHLCNEHDLWKMKWKTFDRKRFLKENRILAIWCSFSELMMLMISCRLLSSEQAVSSFLRKSDQKSALIECTSQHDDLCTDEAVMNASYFSCYSELDWECPSMILVEDEEKDKWTTDSEILLKS